MGFLGGKGLCNNYLEEGGGEIGKWTKYAQKLSHKTKSY